MSKIYKFEDVFTELPDGDLLLTFPEDVGTMFNDGDKVTIEIVGNSLVIKKHDQCEDQTTSNQ